MFMSVFFQNNWILKLREAQEMWKTTLQTTVFREIHHLNNNSTESNDGQNHSTCNNQGSPPNRSVTNFV